ncbi:hypothetical protein P261_01344 [Lachnospiraceae bacterium TWA4]|nr:hypothetical protein P261_01344 [Lachnospiraceae bacterium TWA4]
MTNELEEVQQLADKWKMLYYQTLNQMKENAQSRATIMDFEKDVEDTMDETLKKDIQELTPEEKAIDLLKKGISIRRVVEATGVRKYNVERLKKINCCK